MSDHPYAAPGDEQAERQALADEQAEFHEYSDNPLVEGCIRPEHLAAGHACATPDTFGLLQAVTSLLREAEVVEVQARNHWRAKTQLPTKYRLIYAGARDACQALAMVEKNLKQLWKEEQ